MKKDILLVTGLFSGVLGYVLFFHGLKEDKK